VKAPTARERVIIALDVPDLAGLNAFLDRLEGQPAFYKVGLELFLAEGARAIDAVKARGGRLFLDLKLHDIPETVGRAVASAVRFGAELLTIHTGGGLEMMKRAVDAAGATTVLGVTVLTSLSDADLAADGIAGSVGDAVVRRAKVAAAAGVPGLVCSPQEVVQVKAATGLVTVVPGVRPAGAALGDQKRVATPASTIAAGADFLVIGRPIRDAASPAEAFAAVVREVEQALASPSSTR
jgi:orotidine-5'-phosphate decarboxylase